MKSKKNILLIVLAALIVARVIIMMIESSKNFQAIRSEDAPTSDGVNKEVSHDATLSKTPAEAVTSQNSSTEGNLCHSMREHYQNLDDIKKAEKTSIRFVNVHKKIDGLVYRTRFFYKDSSENEIPTYLLYREDNNDEPILIETSPYKKGPQYLKIEKADGIVLYTEEGVNIGVEQDLFLHYENKVLKDLQGVNTLNLSRKNEGPGFIECRF